MLNYLLSMVITSKQALIYFSLSRGTQRNPNRTVGQSPGRMAESTPDQDSKAETPPNRPEPGAHSEASSAPDDHTRVATIYRDTAGKIRGVAVWIDREQLKKAGINLVDTTGVVLRVTTDGVQLTGVNDS